MEVPTTSHPRKSLTPHLDRKRLIEKGLLRRPNEDNEDSISQGKNSPYQDAPKTKYQLEREGQNEQGQSNPDLVQTLLDSSSVFRSRTALPHGILFDLYEEVEPMLLDLKDIYMSNTKFGFIPRKNSQMEEMVEDVEDALVAIMEHIGKNEMGASNTNKIYADAKAGRTSAPPGSTKMQVFKNTFNKPKN